MRLYLNINKDNTAAMSSQELRNYITLTPNRSGKVGLHRKILKTKELAKDLANYINCVV